MCMCKCAVQCKCAQGLAEGIAMPELDSEEKAILYEKVKVLIREVIDDDS